MIYRGLQIGDRILLLIVIILFLLFTQITFICPPATALLQNYHDLAANQNQYKSQHKLKDKIGYTWQIVLFKETQPGQLPIINLRLVGFPGIAKIFHPQPLEIITKSGKLLTAADEFASASPAPNVGQYNLTHIIDKLSPNEAIKITIPLANQQKLTLQIPAAIVLEWQWLAKEI